MPFKFFPPHSGPVGQILGERAVNCVLGHSLWRPALAIFYLQESREPLGPWPALGPASFH